MTLQIQTPSQPAGAPASAIPASVLDSLASRFRAAGLFLAMLDKDGAVTYHDAQGRSFSSDTFCRCCNMATPPSRSFSINSKN